MKACSMLMGGRCTIDHAAAALLLMAVDWQPRNKGLSEHHERDRSHCPHPRSQARLASGEGADQPGIFRDASADAAAEAEYRVRGSGVPQYWRMLEPEARDCDDLGRNVHAGLCFLQCEDRHAGAGGYE